MKYFTFFSCSMFVMQMNVDFVSSSTAAFANKGMPPPERLRQLLENEMDGTGERKDSPTPIILPCCFDGLSARLVAKAGFEATFMTGFGVSGK
mmetsp:Transcript_3711/g.4378  ORF Transcript_3711/g.4378 Transcript_3711/m.4378 type:complete len:93 (+) Transcript_3711:125-403(+)